MALAKLNRKHLTVDKTVDKYVPVDMNWHLDKQWVPLYFSITGAVQMNHLFSAAPFHVSNHV